MKFSEEKKQAISQYIQEKIAEGNPGITKTVSESLDKAIEELFKGKLTTDSLHHLGEGIFFTSRMMDDFLILSDGKVFCINRYNESILNDIGMQTAGTVVYMSLSNMSTKTAKECFEVSSCQTVENGTPGRALSRGAA